VNPPLETQSSKQRTRPLFGNSSLAIYIVLSAILQTGAMSPLRAGTQFRQYASAGSLELDFGNVAVGGTASQMETITNNTQDSVTIIEIQCSGAPFSVTGMLLPVTILPSQSLTLTAQFSPTSTGVFNGSITLIGAFSQLEVFSMTGTGTGTGLYLTLTPTTLSFGNAVIGEQSSLSVLVTNTSTAGVTITGDTVTGTGFTVANLSLPLTLNPNQTTSFSVNFDPNATGNFTGIVSLTSNAPDSPAIENLSGTGVHAVALSWVASTSTGVTGYDVYRGSISGGPYTQITSTPVSGTAYTDTNVASGATYYYVATAVGPNGEASVYSNEAQATVP